MKASIETAIAAVVPVTSWDYWDGELMPTGLVVGRVILASAARDRSITRYTHKVALGFNAQTLSALYVDVYAAVDALLSTFNTMQGVCLGGATLIIREVFIGEPQGYQAEDSTPDNTWVKTWVAFETLSEA